MEPDIPTWVPIKGSVALLNPMIGSIDELMGNLPAVVAGPRGVRYDDNARCQASHVTLSTLPDGTRSGAAPRGTKSAAAAIAGDPCIKYPSSSTGQAQWTKTTDFADLELGSLMGIEK